MTPEQRQAVDLAFAFSSIERLDPDLNRQPDSTKPINTSNPTGFKFENPFAGAGLYDPYTPLMRAYEGDKVQIRTLVGAHMSAHSYNLHGIKWQFEPADPNSGFRSTQGMGISEHYEMLFDLPRTGSDPAADYLYVPSSGAVALTFGNWGLLRAYSTPQVKTRLQPLPNNPVTQASVAQPVCPADAEVRSYDVTAAWARQVLDAVGPTRLDCKGSSTGTR
jgi:hypothetical protein